MSLTQSHHHVARARFVLALAAMLLVPSVGGTGAQQGAAQSAASGLPHRGGPRDVNVVVRDRNGNPVRGLTRDDFTIIEDGRPQTSRPSTSRNWRWSRWRPPPSLPTVLGCVGACRGGHRPPPPPPAVDMHGRRPIAMLFDLTSMQPEEARAGVRRRARLRRAPADARRPGRHRRAVHVASARAGLHRRPDSAARGPRPDERRRGSRLRGGCNAEADERRSAFAADDSEFTTFNTDRRLEALKTLTEAMAGIEQKKSLIYFSSGMTQTGLDNRVAIRRRDRPRRARQRVDLRGRHAGPAGARAGRRRQPGEHARQAAFSGRSVSSRFDQMAASQDALSSLAEDTGGRAFFDQNDFRRVFDRVVADTSAYYLLGYTSDNRARTAGSAASASRCAGRT